MGTVMPAESPLRGPFSDWGAFYQTMPAARNQYLFGFPGLDTSFVDVFDGTSWINVHTVESTIGAFTAPDSPSINISAYSNSGLKVRFRFNETDGGTLHWAIDNVEITGTFDPCSDNAEVFVTNIAFFDEGTIAFNDSERIFYRCSNRRTNQRPSFL